MPATKQSQAIALANRLLLAGQSAYDLKAEIDAILSLWQETNAGAVFNSMQTAAVNADGSLGAADAAPIVTNPINVQVPPYNSLMRAISANDLAALNTLMGSLQTLLGGTGDPGQQAAFPQALAKIVGG